MKQEHFGILAPTVYSKGILCEGYRYLRDEAGNILAWTTPALAETFARSVKAPEPKVVPIPDAAHYQRREVVA